jgi:hypothetical protein
MNVNFGRSDIEYKYSTGMITNCRCLQKEYWTFYMDVKEIVPAAIGSMQTTM